MMPSMFSLDHRLAELRPSSEELRLARQLREAGSPANRPSRSVGAVIMGALMLLPGVRDPERPGAAAFGTPSRAAE